MLQEKYLHVFHFSEKHDLRINVPPAKIYPLVENLDFSTSPVIKILCFLRGIPTDALGMNGLEKMRFTLMEKIPDKEIIIGLIGQFWKPSGNLQKFQPDQFIDYLRPEFIKATWNFRIIPLNDRQVSLETETRIFCPNEATRKKFSLYWFFIRPFSRIIRKEMLKSIKKKAEGNYE